jgi:hypothetical protein
VERCFLKGGEESALALAERNRGDRLQQLLELAADYGQLGAWEEALVILAQADAVGGTYASPLVKYYAGYCHLQLGGD